VLYSFKGLPDGAEPYLNGGSLIADKKGALYGTTNSGGSFAGLGANTGNGTVFKLTHLARARPLGQ
jgi:hypothetical protein